jgi:hypothetical protein
MPPWPRAVSMRRLQRHPTAKGATKVLKGQLSYTNGVLGRSPSRDFGQPKEELMVVGLMRSE